MYASVDDVVCTHVMTRYALEPILPRARWVSLHTIIVLASLLKAMIDTEICL
jgi:hypothetical protein